MADININSLEPNSYKYRAEKAKEESKKEEKLSPVINRNQVVSTKKPLNKKIAETFLNDDAKDIKTWLIMDVLVPGVKNTILDVISMALFGETNSRNTYRSSNRRKEKISYGDYYRGELGRSSYRSRRDDRYESNDKIDFRNIIVSQRRDAEEVIERMRDRIREFGYVSVAELFDLVDLPGRYTDNNWGWENERDIGIRRVSTGYLIDVSEPKYLN